jgi:hypothetical protein
MGANISFEGFNLFLSSTWVPVFGNWCGPGWSGGVRTINPDFSVRPITIGGRESPVDTACFNHDFAYYSAMGKPDEALLILQADLQLRRDISVLDWGSLSSSEQKYAKLMDVTFAAKIATVDSVSVRISEILTESNALDHQRAQSGINPVGETFTDAQGNSMTCGQDANGKLVFNCSEVLVNGTTVNATFDSTGQLVGLNTGAPASTTFLTNDTSQTNFNNLFNLDNSMSQLFGAGVISANFYNNYSENSTSWLLNTPLIPQIGPFVPGYNPADPYGFGPSLNLDPIGAYYESVTPALDLAPSIADKTPVLLGANNSGLSVSALTTRDANLDGQLTGTELTSLNVWVDLNENGLLDTGELRSLATAGISQIKSADYGFYTQGNAVIGAGVAVTPVRPNEAIGVPAAIAAASNYRALRDTDNIYIVSASPLTYFAWNANQIKINNSNRSYLIGTDGADTFDASIFQQTYNSQYFNYSLLTNFLATGGDDVFGGSSQADNLWGGAGNDCEAANDEMFEMRRMG